MIERVVIVTGAASAIGQMAAEAFFNAGYRVVLADIDDARGQEVSFALDPENKRAIFVDCDISDRLSVHNLLAETLNKFGRVDVLVNNAAEALPSGAAGGIINQDLVDFDRIMAVNLRGTILVTKAVIDVMVDEINNREDRSDMFDGSYSIINMTSMHAAKLLSDKSSAQLAWDMSQGALVQMTRSLAVELAPYGIRVNAIGGASVNHFTDKEINKRDKTLASIVKRAMFLASEKAKDISGEIITATDSRLKAVSHLKAAPTKNADK